jgi:hypothetical protein
MGWGVTITGLSNVSDLFDQLKTQWSGDTLYIVAPTVRYAVYQERGTSSIEARPFMRPAAERVQAAPQAMLRKYQQSPPQSEADVVETLAIAVQNEAKRIANQKGVRDTGALIASITYEEAS